VGQGAKSLSDPLSDSAQLADDEDLAVDVLGVSATEGGALDHAVGALDGLNELPLAEQADVLEGVHDDLKSTLHSGD